MARDTGRGRRSRTGRRIVWSRGLPESSKDPAPNGPASSCDHRGLLTDTVRWVLYAREVADQIGLRDWAVTVKAESPDDENALACMRVTRGRRRVTIWLAREFDTLSPEDQRHAIVHELVHVFLEPMFEVVGTVESNLGDGAWGVFLSNFGDALERATDALAEAIAPRVAIPVPVGEVAR